MTRTRMLAAASAALGGFLAVASGSAFSSGEGGVIALLGAALAVSAAGLLVFAVVMFRRRPSTAAVREPVRHTVFQRIALVVIGAMALAWSGNAIVTGKFDASGSRRDVLRSANPSHFWQIVSVYLLTGGACLYFGLRPDPGQGGGSTPRPKRPWDGRTR